MKKSFVYITLLSAVLFISCEKKTTTTVNDEGEITTVEKVGFDEEQIDSTAQNVKEEVNKAAQKTGKALEHAGKKIKEEVDKAEKDLKKSTNRSKDTIKVNSGNN